MPSSKYSIVASCDAFVNIDTCYTVIVVARVACAFKVAIVVGAHRVLYTIFGSISACVDIFSRLSIIFSRFFRDFRQFFSIFTTFFDHFEHICDIFDTFRHLQTFHDMTRYLWTCITIFDSARFLTIFQLDF